MDRLATSLLSWLRFQHLEGLAVQSILRWTLILHLLHCPIPFPDLDGECRGTPIASLSELHAWHVMLLGVRPNDDIDRGPIHTTDEPADETPVEPALGIPAIAGTPFAPIKSISLSAVSTIDRADCILQSEIATLWHVQSDHKPIVPVSRTARICFGSWQV